MINSVVNYSELYLFEDPFSNRWLRIKPLPEWVNEELADRLAYGQLKPSKPVVFRGFMGGPVADILWTSLPPMVCISEKVVNLLEENRFNGWSTYPVEVSDRKGNTLTDYHGFAIMSYAGERDRSRSPIIEREPIALGGKVRKVYKGFYFDENKWDGADIFRVHTSWLVVTKAVRDAFIKSKIRNVEFIALPDEETSTTVYM
jgi:hypothetical protein